MVQINSWFFKHADGTAKVLGSGESKPPWTVFWCGIDDAAVIDDVVALAGSMPRSYFSEAEFSEME